MAHRHPRHRSNKPHHQGQRKRHPQQPRLKTDVRTTESNSAENGRKEEPNRRARLIREFLIGLCCIVVLLLARVGFGFTEPGKELDAWGYSSIQEHLAGASAANYPVAVVDTSDVEQTRSGALWSTRRDTLLQLIEAAKAKHAVAVGVDIDLSPDYQKSPWGYVRPDDPKFFRQCAALDDARFHVYLGVGRTNALGPAYWLGDPAYAGLAGGILVPKEDKSHLVGWVRNGRSSRSCPSMGELLGQELGFPQAPLGAKPSSLLFCQTQSEHYGSIDLSLFPVDYGPLRRYLSERPEIANDQPGRGIVARRCLYSSRELREGRTPDLTGQAVLLGDVLRTDYNDSYGFRWLNGSVPGVFLHACAALTLSRSPLYEFTPIGQYVIDFLLGLVLLVVVIATSKEHAGPNGRRTRQDTIKDLLQVGILVAVVAAIILFSLYAVTYHRVLWSDYLLSALSIGFHPRVHHLLGLLYKTISTRANK